MPRPLSPAAGPRSIPGPCRTLPGAALLTALFALFGLDNILLLRFLGIAAPAVWLAAGGALAFVLHACSRQPLPAVPVRRLALCLAAGLVLMMLGGQGRLFYANIDWQVRDAVLADMIRWPWPFAYAGFDEPRLLRAPIGMYLIPALVGKAAGRPAADLALLVQNGLACGLVLALASLLVPSARVRRVTLACFLLFSGMDTLGLWLIRPGAQPLPVQIDDWAHLQYSSTLTLLFWVPQHALSGWAGALLFLLWRQDVVRLGILLAALPVCLLWSPLGVMGTLPFAALAGIATLARRGLAVADVAMPAAALVVAAAAILFLGADAGAVGIRVLPIPPVAYAVFQLIEVVPLLVLPATAGAIRAADRAAVLVVVACLLAFPFIVIGTNVDFQMRASIPALAILAMVCGRVLAEGAGLSRLALGGVLAIGALTPLHVLAAALAFRPSPPPVCDVAQAWDQSFAPFDNATYFARLSRIPAAIRPAAPTPAPPTRAAACWSRPWAEPR